MRNNKKLKLNPNKKIYIEYYVILSYLNMHKKDLKLYVFEHLYLYIYHIMHCRVVVHANLWGYIID